MTPDIRKERETALYEAALRLIAKGVNPAAMKVQQIADEAGIGKGTVYEYFASKDEILQGMALYCFDTEIARIAVLMEPCTTLQELEDAVMAYLQDLSGNRMGTYQVIASSIGARENLRGMRCCWHASVSRSAARRPQTCAPAAASWRWNGTTAATAAPA